MPLTATMLDSTACPSSTVLFTVIGAVNTGKSTLCGQILRLVGAVSPPRPEARGDDSTQYGPAPDKSRELAQILDQDESERESGNTHSAKQHQFEFDGRSFVLWDTPGHTYLTTHVVQTLLHPLMAGSSTTVVCILVSGRRGEFESAFDKSNHMKELIVLAKLAGAQRVVFAVTKLDEDGGARTADEEAALLSGLRRRITAWLREVQVNFAATEWVAVSGWTGRGIKEALLRTLARVADAGAPSTRDDTKKPSRPNRSTSAAGSRAVSLDDGSGQHWAQVQTLPPGLVDPADRDALLTSGTECVCHIGCQVVDAVLEDLHVSTVPASGQRKMKPVAFARLGETFVCRIVPKNPGLRGRWRSSTPGDGKAAARQESVACDAEQLAPPTRMVLRRGLSTLGGGLFAEPPPRVRPVRDHPA